MHRADAEAALLLIQEKHPAFAIAGQPIRASWAHGAMPDWKRGRALLTPRERHEVRARALHHVVHAAALHATVADGVAVGARRLAKVLCLPSAIHLT